MAPMYEILAESYLYLYFFEKKISDFYFQRENILDSPNKFNYRIYIQISYHLYVTILPILFSILFIFDSTVKEDSTIILPLITAAFFHPIGMLPFGMMANNLMTYLQKHPYLKGEITKRLLTYSMNIHLTIMANKVR